MPTRSKLTDRLVAAQKTCQAPLSRPESATMTPNKDYYNLACAVCCKCCPRSPAIENKP